MSLTVLSQRGTRGGLSSQLAYGAWHEAEDVLVSAAGAELALVNQHGKTARIRARRVGGRAVRRLAGRSVLLPAFHSGLATHDPGGDHVIFVAHGPWDLPLIERLKDLRRQASSISVWMPEVWPTDLADKRLLYESYTLLDHLFVGIPEAVEPFKAIVPDVNVRCVPLAADVVIFGTRNIDAKRGIDVLGVGRRHEPQHQAILDWADRNDKLYLYDSVSGTAVDWLDHRYNLANWYRHSKLAVCNYAKHDLPNLIGGIRSIPGRLYEGLAAGSILVGLAPSEEAQRKVLGIPVVESTEQCSLTTVLDKFSDEETTRSERIRNAAMAARGHDWAHRWRVILRDIGMPEPAGLTERIESLGRRADELEMML